MKSDLLFKIFGYGYLSSSIIQSIIKINIVQDINDKTYEIKMERSSGERIFSRKYVNQEDAINDMKDFIHEMAKAIPD